MAESTYYRRKRLRQCVKCGGVPVEGKTLCKACADYQSKKYKEERREYEAKGICPVCKRNKPQMGRKMCKQCLLKNSEYAWNKGRRALHG